MYGGRGLRTYAKYIMKSDADKQSPWQIPIAVSMYFPILLPILTLRVTSVISRYIMWSSPGVSMFCRICMSFDRLTVSKALDMSNSMKML